MLRPFISLFYLLPPLVKDSPTLALVKELSNGTLSIPHGIAASGQSHRLLGFGGRPIIDLAKNAGDVRARLALGDIKAGHSEK